MNHIGEITKSLTTIGEMLADRGIATTNLNRLSRAEVQGIVSARNIFSIATSQDNSIVVIYDLSPKLVWKDTKKYIDSLDPEPKLIIIVVRNSADIRKIVGMDEDHQVFSLNELQFNRSHHVLVPKHELINDNVAITRIFEECQIQKGSQLPIILKTDPMAKYLNAKPGNVIKVLRVSPTCGENVVYRFVS